MPTPATSNDHRVFENLTRRRCKVPEVKARVIRERIDRELDSLRAQSQFRTLDISSGVNLSSNDYLGLSTDPRLKQSLMETVAQGPRTGSTGSRLLTGNSRDWQELESTFAEFARTEAALYFGSGYAANVGLLSSLLKPGDVVFSDALNHASLIDGIRLSGGGKSYLPALRSAISGTRAPRAR